MNKGKIVGICLACIHVLGQERQVRSICEHLEQDGYQVMIYNMSTKLDRVSSHEKGEISILNIIPYDKLDALVILSESIRNEMVCQSTADLAIKQGVPVIAIDHPLRGCYNLTLAYGDCFETIVRHLIEYHKCKDINFLAGFKGNEFSDERIQVFKRVMAENGLEWSEEYLEYGDFWERPSRKIAMKWVEQWKSGESRQPEAVICANDVMAITVSNVLQSNGIKVPDDVIVTGFDGLELGQCCTPKLTTAKEDTERIGEYTCEIIQKCVENPGLQPYDVEIPFHFVLNESCGCKKIEWRNLSEEILHWYGRSGQISNLSEDLYRMMNQLSDGHSVESVAKKLEEYQWILSTDNMVMCINDNLYQKTDLRAGEAEGQFMKLVQIKEGEFSVPMQMIPDGKELEDLAWIREKTGQLLLVPLHWQSEEYGFIAISNDWDKLDYSVLYEFTMSINQVLGAVRKQAQLYGMYVRDALTYLYNRQGFYSVLEKRMKQLQDKKKVLFLASVDMDCLKYVNDTFGHSEGDYAICRIGEVLEKTVEGRDGICARFGGDEYTVGILQDETQVDEQFFENYPVLLKEALDELNSHTGKPYQISASCGAVWKEIGEVDELESLMIEADSAMYVCKDKHHKELGIEVRR